MKAISVRRFRVELLQEAREDVAPLLDRYAAVVNGTSEGSDTWRKLKALNLLGVARGTFQTE